jgi:hypothetical protein
MQTEQQPSISILFFFPEILGFGIIVVLSPLWVVRLVHQGHYVLAVFVAALTAIGATSFVWLLVKRRRLTAWLIMAAVFFTIFLLHNSLPT